MSNDGLRPSRRAALRGLGAGLVASWMPAIVPSSVLGGDDAPSNRARLGFIGVGNQGMNNLRKLVGHAAALCDVDAMRLGAARAFVAAKSGKIPAGHADYRALLDDKSIDGVVITTPDHWHALPTIHACQAGKDVYIEKPLSLTVEEGRVMVAAARRFDRVVQTGSQQRSDAKFRRACEIVRSGRLGKLKKVVVGLPGVNFEGPPVPDAAPPKELDYETWLGTAPERPYNPKHVHYNFRFFWDYSGGQMTNWGAHHLDIVQWALGRDDSGPEEVEGWAEYHPEGWYEVPRASGVTYRYGDGTTVLLEQGDKTKARKGAYFEGEDGWLFVTRGKLEGEPKELLDPAKPGEVALEVSDDHHANWLECIKTRARPICDVAIGHRSATLCHLGNIAARIAVNTHASDGGRDTGQVTWDPAKERIVAHVGSEDAAAMLSRPGRGPWRIPAISEFAPA